MRRSLGTRPTTLPPKRVRQSQENVVPTTGRQSRSNSNSGLSSEKRVSSMSRLPVAAGTTKKRSSSSHGAPALTELPRNAMTPSSSRSVSKRDTFTTPQRVSQAPPRMSMGGTATKRASGRGSQMGARVLKDTRPLTDKSYQLEEIKKLLDFLRRNKYANTSLTSKHFPLNTKEFVNIFNFLYSFLDPRITNKIPSAKFEEEALKTLKSLNYPQVMAVSSSISHTILMHIAYGNAHLPYCEIVIKQTALGRIF